MRRINHILHSAILSSVILFLGCSANSPHTAYSTPQDIGPPPTSPDSCRRPLLELPQRLLNEPTGTKLSATVHFTLSPAGQIGNIKIGKRSGLKAFDEWVVSSVQRWSCPPGIRTSDIEVEAPFGITIN